ncbi:MAG: efflux RND transporter permease subunit [Rikenellaceae bacterium]|nr:efflux RND transporter permease subunit [Rikenellaceae bacterium]
MKIYESAVRKPISTILIFVGVIVFGLFSLRNLAVDMYPEMDIPTINVITTYQGANAADIETNITRIFEDNLNTVENLKKMTSRSSDNVSVITLEFEWGSDLTEAANDIRDAISRVQSLIPDDADQPTIFKFSSSMIPVVMISATADQSYAALYKILDEKLVNVLNRIDGVGAVSMFGEPTREIQVNVDPQKIEAYNISVEQIGQILAAENINIPGGTIDLGNSTFNVKADGEFTASDQLRSIVVANRGGRDILLSDVAVVKDTLEKMTIDERVNSRKGVRIIVQKQSGSNTVQIADAVMSKLDDIQKTLPPDVKLDLIMDSSESIKDSIASLSDTVMYAFIFVVLVVLFFLGRWRATFIIVLTIPVSLIVSFIYLYMTGSTLNIISLSSLSIAIGMVVDDAIVVLENITKHIERGSSPREASIYATNEVWLAVIATTLTVVAVFLPLTMIGGIAGIMFRELGWIVTLVVCVSTAAAITLTPMLTSVMLKANRMHSYKGLGILFRPIDRFLDRLDSGYGRLLGWVLRHRASVIVGSILIFASSLLLLLRVPTDFFPSSDNGIIAATVQLDQNLSVEYTAAVARRIDSLIYAKYPEIEIVSTSTGAASSNKNAFAALQQSGSYYINYTLKLPRASQRERTIFEISDLFRDDLDRMPEVRQYTVNPGGSSGGSAMGAGTNVKLKVFGYDFNTSNDVAGHFKEQMQTIHGLRDVQLSRDDLQPEFNIRFDRDRLARYGLNYTTAASYVRNRINGLIATKYREDGDEYDIVVRYDEPFRRSIEDIENITLYNAQGGAIKLKDVAVVAEEFAPPTIERENRQRVVSVEGTLSNVALGEVVSQVQALVDSTHLPDGIAVEIGGTVEDQGESFDDMLTLLVLIVILVYIVMATQFESLVMPMIIMCTMPLAFTGVFLALWITGTPLSMIALIGAIMLVGIVVKNGIVIVDFTNLLRDRGQSINQAVINSGKSRLRPVLMTSLTTILGMVPLALGTGEGSEVWQPMGIAVIGGLTFSTLLTLLVIPVVYSFFGGRAIARERRRNALLYSPSMNGHSHDDTPALHPDPESRP